MLIIFCLQVLHSGIQPTLYVWVDSFMRNLCMCGELTLSSMRVFSFEWGLVVGANISLLPSSMFKINPFSFILAIATGEQNKRKMKNYSQSVGKQLMCVLDLRCLPPVSIS